MLASLSLSVPLLLVLPVSLSPSFSFFPLPLLPSLFLALIRSGSFGAGVPLSRSRAAPDIGHSRARACERPRERERGGKGELYRVVPLRGWRGTTPRASKLVGRAAIPHTRSTWGTERDARSLSLSLPFLTPRMPSRCCATRYFRATRARRTIGTRVVPP